MNLRLILLLSFFGLFMAFGTVFWIPFLLEPFIWFIIFILCAWIIARRSSGNYFLQGFLLSLFNSVWVIAIHLIFYGDYIFSHLNEAAMLQNMPWHNSPRILIFITGVIIGIISGVILGLFSVIASRITKKVSSE